MREIKFRAWSNRDKCWCGAFSVHKSGLWRESQNNEWTDLSQQSEIVLMQYTGLKDKNGKEIYEGDIVKGFYPDLGQVKFGEHETSTDYYASIAYGWFIETLNKETYQIKIQDNTEIIGNIYENPELIK